MKEGYRGNWKAEYPHLGTGPVPTDVFTSREQFELEREHIWKKAWLNVGRVEQIPEAGDYLFKDIAICQTSILVVRGNDGEIRAFHNMCTHRGNKLAWDDRGSCKGFTCKFHGWSFGIDGALRHVPDEEDFYDLKRDEKGLTRVACDVWEGFVFINVDPNPEESLEEYLGEIATQFRGYPFSEVTATAGVWTAELKANWKLVKDSFAEAYHLKQLHKRIAVNMPANPHNHFLDLQLFPRHAKFAGGTPPGPKGDRRLSQPSQALAFKYGAMGLGAKKGELPAGLNHLGHKDWNYDVNVIFPAFWLIVSAGSIVRHNFWPVDVDRTYWQMTQYMLKPQTVGQRFGQEIAHIGIRDVAMEDGSTLEQTQSMLSSGAIKGVTFKDEEIVLRHQHNVVKQMINGQAPQIPRVAPAVNEEAASV